MFHCTSILYTYKRMYDISENLIHYYYYMYVMYHCRKIARSYTQPAVNANEYSKRSYRNKSMRYLHRSYMDLPSNYHVNNGNNFCILVLYEYELSLFLSYMQCTLNDEHKRKINNDVNCKNRIPMAPGFLNSPALVLL